MLQRSGFSLPAPLVSIAAIAVILTSLTAIGAVTGLIPSAFSSRADPPVEQSATPTATANGPAQSAALMATADRPAQLRIDGRLATAATAPQCRQCGVVEAVRQVQIKTQGTGLGVIAGGANGSIVSSQFGRGSGRSAIGAVDVPWGGFAGPEIERKGSVTTGYRVVVRMEDGSTRTIYQSAVPAFHVGEKIRVVNGVLAARG